MLHSKIILLTVILACFSSQFLPTEAGYVTDKLKGIAKSVCNFFRPGHRSTTQTSQLKQNSGVESETTPTYDIDIRANEEGMDVELQNNVSVTTRRLIDINMQCPPGQRMIRPGQCRPPY